jgi:phage-related protein (TIGR01555 family)
MLGTADSTSDQTMPLADETVSDLKWTAVLKSSEFSARDLYDNQETDGQMFGLPKIWNVTRLNGSGTIPVHESRIILTRGIPTSDELRQDNDWRDISVLQAPYEPLRNYNSAGTGIAQMLLDASQAVLKIRELAKLLADDPDVLTTRMRILELARALHVMPIDAGDLSGQGAEDFFFAERTFSGVADAFDRLLGMLASSIGWPQTYLFGRSPAGENATGESDREMWDDLVAADQRDVYLPHLQRLVTLAAYAEKVTDPEGWTVEFAPLRQETDAERVDREGAIADTDVKYITAGVYDELDVAEHRFSGEEYDATPIRISEENGEAAKLLREQDLARARGEVPAGAMEAGVDPTKVAVPEGPVSSGATSAAETVEKTTMNGSQLDKVLAAMEKTADRKIEPGAARAFLSKFFPISPEDANEVIGEMGTTWFAGDGDEPEEDEPAPVPPAFAAQQAAPGVPVGEAEEEGDEDGE